jgi:hypothetical protein
MSPFHYDEWGYRKGKIICEVYQFLMAKRKEKKQIVVDSTVEWNFQILD